MKYFSILLENESYVEKRFTKCTDTFLEKIKNLTHAKSLCDESSYCNAITVPHLNSPDHSYKLCKGKYEFSQSESIYAKGNLDINFYSERAIFKLVAI